MFLPRNKKEFNSETEKRQGNASIIKKPVFLLVMWCVCEQQKKNGIFMPMNLKNANLQSWDHLEFLKAIKRQIYYK